MAKKEKETEDDLDDNEARKRSKEFIDVSPVLKEADDRIAVLSFGRFNPITIGHEKLVEKLISEARKRNGVPLLYLSHTQDNKKNPLTYKEKILLAEKAFGRRIVVRSKSRNIIEILKEINRTFSRIIMVVGSDRVSEFERLLNSANEKDFRFVEFSVISAGDRDPDSTDKTQSASASKAREFARNDDFESFRKILPKALSSDAASIFKIIQERLGTISEDEVIESSKIFEGSDGKMKIRKNQVISERHHKLYGPDNKILLDRRFKIFRHLRNVDVKPCTDLKVSPVDATKDTEMSNIVKDVEFSLDVMNSNVTENEKLENIALETLRRLVVSQGDKESLEGLAFTVTREFDGLNLSARDLAKKFRERFGTVEFNKNAPKETVDSAVTKILRNLIAGFGKNSAQKV